MLPCYPTVMRAQHNSLMLPVTEPGTGFTFSLSVKFSNIYIIKITRDYFYAYFLNVNDQYLIGCSVIQIYCVVQTDNVILHQLYFSFTWTQCSLLLQRRLMKWPILCDRKKNLLSSKYQWCEWNKS